ncbi:MAG: hypothetical protein K0R00_3185 [Herbinix sp.]|nr:hypothetical protein [Herbinix sp.]
MRIRKCDLCGKLVRKRTTIINKHNEKTFDICLKCLKEFEFEDSKEVKHE